MFPPTADLHGEIPIPLPRFVRHDLHSVQLHDCAGIAASGLRVVDGAHAFFDAESAASWGKCIGFSLEGGGGGGFE